MKIHIPRTIKLAKVKKYNNLYRMLALVSAENNGYLETGYAVVYKDGDDLIMESIESISGFDVEDYANILISYIPQRISL